MSKQKKEAAPRAMEQASAVSSNTDHDTPKTGKKSRETGRTRNFAKLVYPTKEQYEAWYEAHPCDGDGVAREHYEGEDGYGDAPDDWMHILDDAHVAAFVSPLHDQDHNPDGKLKKPHYHVMIMFEGVKTQKQADEIFNRIHGVGKEEINSMRGYARYMQHLDNPEKYQYGEKPRTFGGADYDAVIHLPGDDTKNVKDMMRYIRANQIKSFAEFCDICAANNDEWFGALVHRTAYFIKEYIKSLDWEDEKHYTRQER